MIYRKLKRTWSHRDLNYIPNFRKVFPELSNIDSEELRNSFVELGLDFYTEQDSPVSIWNRLTLPIALILALLMFVSLPVVFMVTGKWGYSLGEKNRVYNWFKSLGLV